MTDQTVQALPEPGGDEDLALASVFPPATREQWRKLVAKVLGDAVTPDDAEAPEHLLAVMTVDGIEIEPLYTAEDDGFDLGYPGEAPFVRGSAAVGHRSGWDVRQRHANPDPKVAREQIMADLEGGVSSVWLGLGEGQTPVESLGDVLSDVYLDLAPVVLDAGARAGEAATLFFDLVTARGFSAADVPAVLGVDPLSVAARTGGEADLTEAAALAARCASEFPAATAIVADSLPYNEAGAAHSEELGCGLAAGVDYLRAMEAAGLSGDAAFGQVEFRYAATADQFITIAKLRAARRLWARVAEQCGVSGPAAGQRQHAVTSWTMMTQRDPWNNILRSTLACFGAGVGGADAVTVLPFDTAIGLPDDLARRIARNSHALLVEESNVARVIDPAGGSWYVESLTESIAEKAWEWFQTIEAEGGLAKALKSGLVADRIAASREAQLAALAHRKATITGVSEFPLQGEKVLDRTPVAAPTQAAGGGLPRLRWSQWHENLRDRSDSFAAKNGSAPSVTLVKLGSDRSGAAQVERVSGLLAPAGIVTVEATLDALCTGEAPTVVCVCAGKDVEADEVSGAVDSARAAGVGYVMVAATSVPNDKADEVVTAKPDVFVFLARTLEALGVAK